MKNPANRKTRPVQCGDKVTGRGVATGEVDNCRTIMPQFHQTLLDIAEAAQREAMPDEHEKGENEPEEIEGVVPRIERLGKAVADFRDLGKAGLHPAISARTMLNLLPFYWSLTGPGHAAARNRVRRPGICPQMDADFRRFWRSACPSEICVNQRNLRIDFFVCPNARRSS